MKNKINKRGDKYYIMISLILGLIVLSLSLYFIFQEFFTQDMIDQESCRQSVYLRATLPEVDFKGFTVYSFKNDFPLKCKTQVFEITKKDIEEKRAGKIIADTMVQCWSTFGNGDYKIFPSEIFDSKSFCIPCARISLTDEAKKYLNDHPEINIDIQDTLENDIYKGVIYRGYLNTIGGRQALPSSRELGADSFRIGDEASVSENAVDVFWKYFGKTFIGGFFKVLKGIKVEKIYMPKLFDPSDGDLLIMYGSITFFWDGDKNQDEKSEGIYVPYLFYFQIDQVPDPFIEIKNKKLITGIKKLSLGICDNWEGIPA